MRVAPLINGELVLTCDIDNPTGRVWWCASSADLAEISTSGFRDWHNRWISRLPVWNRRFDINFYDGGRCGATYAVELVTV